MRDSMVFYKSFLASIRLLPKKHQLQFYNALFDYGFDGVEPSGLPGGAAALFNALKPQVDANNRKYENGKKGGRPKINQDETKPKPNDNQTETKVEPNENVNVNVNSNVNKNVDVDGNASGSANADVWALSRSLLSYLNAKAGSSWRIDDAVGVRLISDLAHKGYSEEQMKEVIDRKCDEWLGDPKMEHYLRPSTLFKPDNFVKYLNAPDSARRQKQEQDAEESRRIDEEIRKMKEDGERELARMKEAHEKFMRENGLRN